MAAAVQRKAIEDELQRFTLRVTRRTVPIIFSMMLVQASERRNSAGRPSLLTVRISSNPSRMLCEAPGASRSRRWARLRISFSAFAASSSSQAWRNARRTEACRAGDRRSVMFRALWIWQRWIGMWRPKLRRIALASAFLRDRTLPSRQCQFLSPEVAHAGPLNRHLAGVEADLALGSAPAMTAPAIAAGMASPASLLGVLFHHGPERLDPGRQTEPIKADRNGVPSFVHSPHSSRRQSGQWCDSFLHGVAFLSWNQHPEPTGSRRATPLLLFQHSPGQFRISTAREEY